MNEEERRHAYTRGVILTILRWSVVELGAIFFIALAIVNLIDVDPPFGMSVSSTTTALLFGAIGLVLGVQATRHGRRDLRQLARRRQHDEP